MSTARQPGPDEIAASLHAAAIYLLRKLRRVDTASGLNAPRLSALSVLVFGGPLTLGQLAAAEQVRPPTMTRIVHALEARRLVRKSGNAEDRRTVRLSATMQGKRVMLAARRRRVQGLAAQIARLSAAERKTLRAAIAIIEGPLRGQ